MTGYIPTAVTFVIFSMISVIPSIHILFYMKKKQLTKLQLRKLTVASLQATEQLALQGGAALPSRWCNNVVAIPTTTITFQTVCIACPQF
jgi:hypothetical protein